METYGAVDGQRITTSKLDTTAMMETIETMGTMGTAGGATVKAATNREAGTTVFVGRASFRMEALNNRQNETEQEECATPELVLAQPETRWFAPSERVVLAPPESVTRAVPAAAVSDAAVEESFLSTLATLDAERRVTARRSTPLWAIAAAIVVGATATLSAQAVMRRPARALATTASAAPRSQTGAVTEQKAAPTMKAAPLPTVVRSTATLAQADAPRFLADDPATQNGVKSLAGAVRVLTGRAGRPVAARSGGGESAASKTTGSAAGDAWFDPFVGHTVRPSSGRNTTAAGKTNTLARGTMPAARAQARTTETAWVDPFVN